MRRMIFASLVVAASLAIPAASATAAGGHWSKPVTLVPTGTPTYEPVAAIGRDGTAVIVWDDYNAKTSVFSVLAAVRKPTGSTKIKVLGKTAGPSSQPSLAAGGDGTFAVAWEQPGSKVSQNYAVVSLLRPGAAFFGKATIVSGSNVSTQYGSGDFPQVAVDDAGTVYAVWEGIYSKHTQVVASQVRRGSRSWSSQARLSKPGVDAHAARLAANGKGRALVSWSESGGDLHASLKPANASSFGAAQVLSNSSFPISPLSLGVSDAGKFAAVWDGAGTQRGLESKVTRGSRFPSAGQYLSRSGASFQAAALASNGSGVAAWLANIAGGSAIEATLLKASSTSWSKGASRLNTVGYAAFFGVRPAVAVDNERAIVAWRQRDVQKKDTVAVRVRPAGLGWQPPTIYPALGTAVTVAVPADPARSGRVLGLMVWASIKGLQISILK